MDKYLVSELAIEQGLHGSKALTNGFRIERAELSGARVTSIRVPIGTVRTDMQKMLAAKAVSAELRRLIPDKILRSNAPVTVICLGNPSLTADSLGPLCADEIVATRALKTTDEQAFLALGGREVTVLRSGTAGHSGIEAYELLISCQPLLKPALIIAIDSLKAVKRASLSSVIQISTAGISPGSGIGNGRSALDSKTRGIPVVSIGSPTAISSGALICDALKQSGVTSLSAALEKALERGSDLTVSAADADRTIRLHADIIARAINLTFLGFAEI